MRSEGSRTSSADKKKKQTQSPRRRSTRSSITHSQRASQNLFRNWNKCANRHWQVERKIRRPEVHGWPASVPPGFLLETSGETYRSHGRRREACPERSEW